MSKTQALREAVNLAEEPAGFAPAVRARAALDGVRRRAVDVRARAQGQARAAIDRRRTAAAVRLEDLAAALRPDDPEHAARARRKAAAIAGASGAALIAAVGLGMALGVMISRRLKRRSELRARVAGGAPPARQPEVVGQDLTEVPASALDF